MESDNSVSVDLNVKKIQHKSKFYHVWTEQMCDTAIAFLELNHTA